MHSSPTGCAPSLECERFKRVGAKSPGRDKANERPFSNVNSRWLASLDALEYKHVITI